MNDLIKQRVIRQRYLNSYLAELNHLFSINISDNNLQSLEFTRNHIERIHQMNKALIYTESLPFSQREQLKEILINNNFLLEKPYYFWAIHSDSCGLLAVPSMECFNWSFDFDIDKNGIIVFFDTLFKQEVVIDFYDEREKQIIKIALWGLE